MAPCRFCRMSPTLVDKSDLNRRKVKVLVEAGSDGIYIYPEGYGEKGAVEGYGSPVFLEVYDGDLRVIVSPDINDEEPQAISLEGAREDKRKDDEA